MFASDAAMDAASGWERVVLHAGVGRRTDRLTLDGQGDLFAPIAYTNSRQGSHLPMLGTTS